MLPWRFILSINKFSKYGIVLVAAITLATAVQTQFGQSSTKVYAEETASDPNYKDWRMFYAYFAEYPDDPNYGAMSGRVTTVSEPYIVGEEPYGPGSYDIFDITGKHYNVGDVITINEPFLNHKNEEDNRLYYYYHPQNSDNTSETPAVSTTPATSEAPAVSTTPATSEAPAVSTTPAASEAPAVSTTPATSEAPAVSTTPATSEAPAVSTTPATSEAPAVSTTPATSEAPAVSTTPATSEAPAVSTTPATSEAPAVSTTPATSEAPAVSTTPATSEAPAVSTTPATSEAPAVSTTPATSEASAVSTTPATGLVPSKNIHSMNSVTSPFTQTRNTGIKSEADGKLTSHDLPKTGDTNSKVGMLGMVLVGLGLTSFVYKGRHRRS